MKMLAALSLALGTIAAPALAQEWPEGMVQPANYPWAMIWPVNNPDDVTKIILSEEYKQAYSDYMDFATERNPSGMARPFHRESDYRKDLAGQGLVQRISSMNVGDVETWKGTGYNGQFKLVGTEMVGPHTCRQVEWTMSNPGKVIVGNAAGKAIVYKLYCLNPADNMWFEIRQTL